MLYECRRSLTLEKNYHDISFFSVAYDESYVYVAVTQTRQEYLVHCNKLNKIIFEKLMEEGSKAYSMITDQEIVIAQTNRNRITQVNLKKQSMFSFIHQFTFSESSNKELQTFSQSRFLCVKQYGGSKQNCLKLTYYSYPFSPQSKSIASYQSKPKDWMYNYQLAKGDHHSLIIMYKSRHRNFLEFHTFHINANIEGIFRSYKICDPTFQILQQSNEIAISNMWKANDGQLLAAYSSHGRNDLRIAIFPQMYILLVKLNTNELKKIQSLSECPQDAFLNETHNFGLFSRLIYIKWIHQDTARFIDSYQYYIDHDSLSLVIKRKERSTQFNHGFHLGYDNSTYLQISQEKSTSETVNFRYTKIMKPKEVYLHFMLQIYDDFDDDLLQDSLELLDVL